LTFFLSHTQEILRFSRCSQAYHPALFPSNNCTGFHLLDPFPLSFPEFLQLELTPPDCLSWSKLPKNLQVLSKVEAVLSFPFFRTVRSPRSVDSSLVRCLFPFSLSYCGFTFRPSTPPMYFELSPECDPSTAAPLETLFPHPPYSFTSSLA